MKKKVLLTSVLTIALCLSLVVGATFALFGSKSETDISVKSAKVDVTATVDTESVWTKQHGEEYQEGDSHMLGEISFDGGNIALSNFAPGDGVQFNVNLKNNSNINIQYRAQVACVSGETLFGQLTVDFDLERQLWTAVPAFGTIQPITVTIEFPYTDDYQDYQGLSTELAFTVEAVQGNADTENDVITVAATGSPEENGAALLQALKDVSDGGTVYVSAGEFALPQGTYDSSINGELPYGLLVDKSVTLKGAKAGVPADDPSRGTGETVLGGAVSGYNTSEILIANYDVDVVIDGFTFESSAWDIIGNDDPGVRNATIVNNVFNVNAAGSTPIKLKLAGGEISGNKFVGTSCGYGVRVNAIDTRESSWGGPVPDITVDVTIANNDFSGFGLQDTSRGVVSVNAVHAGTVALEGNNFTGIAGNAIVKENDTAGIEITSNNDIGVTEDNVSDGVTLENRYIADGFIYDYAKEAYVVSNANGLVYFAQSVNGGETYAGKTVLLFDDIDLAGVEWTPIGNVDSYPGITFRGTFDGQGNTISNMTAEALDSEYETAGFFGSICGTVQNLNFVNANVTSHHYAGVVAGYSSANGSKIINCHVADSSVTSVYEGGENTGDKAGGIIGYCVDGDTVNGCSVTDVTVTANRDAGGIAGCAEYPAGIINNTVTNIHIELVDSSYNTWGYILGRKSAHGANGGDSYVPAENNNKVEGNNTAVVPIADGFVKNLSESRYEISNANGLVYFAQSVNGGESYANQTIVLMDDIDLTDIEWTPIDAWKGELSNAVIDGNGKTVYNLTIHGEGQGRFGFIGENTSTMTIRDLTFSGAEITNSGTFSAVVIGYQYGAVTLTNVDVTDSKVLGRESTDDVKDIRIGGLVGFSILNDGAKLYLTDCDVTGSEFYGYHNVAGLVGTLYDCWGDVNASYGNGAYVPKEAWSMTGCTVMDCRFTIDGPSANYVNAFAVDSAYVKTFDEATAAFEELGNTQSGNTFTYTAGLLNMGNDTYHLFNADGLVSLNSNVNGGNSYAGKTIVLMDDIDLTDIEWTPIGTTANPFSGTFDGNDKTISNLTVDGDNYVGLFGYTAGNVELGNFTLDTVNIAGSESVGAVVGTLAANGNVNGVIVKNATIQANHWAGGVVGYTYGNIENCEVSELKIVVTPNSVGDSYDNGDKAGGIVGFLANGSVSGCIVENAEISAFRDLGGIVGIASYENTAPSITRNTLKNITLSYVEFDGPIGASHENAGAVIGRRSVAYEGQDISQITEENNTLEKVTVPATPETAQSVLDNLVGGETVVFAAGEYGDLSIRQSKTRTTATTYGVDPATEIAIADLEDGPTYNYYRTLSNVTLKGGEGAVFTGTFSISSGHVYGSEGVPVTDHIRGISKESSLYFSYITVDVLTLQGMDFVGVNGRVNIEVSLPVTISNLTIDDCSFIIDEEASTSGQAIRLQTDMMGVYSNITVKDTVIQNHYQGVYTQNVNRIALTDNIVSGTGHNAFAVQNGGGNDGELDYFSGEVVISGNTVSNASDRAIRFGIGQNATIEVSNNTFISAVDSDGELLRSGAMVNCNYSFTANTYAASADAEATNLGDVSGSESEWFVKVS